MAQKTEQSMSWMNDADGTRCFMQLADKVDALLHVHLARGKTLDSLQYDSDWWNDVYTVTDDHIKTYGSSRS